MSETATVVPTEEQQTPEAGGRQSITIESPRLGNNFWGVETKEDPKAESPAEQKVETKTEVPKEEPKKEEEEIVEPNTWLKEKFGWDNEEAAKAEIEQLRKLKDVKQEYKFENEESKRLADAIAKGDRKTVLDILGTQDKLESLSAADVNDDTAEAILKLAMQLKHKDLSQKEIDYKFNKEFGLPKEPVKRDDELDEEFDTRKAQWADTVNDIKMNRNIEAKLAKPELDVLKTKIVLPETQEQVQQKQLTQEELDAAKKYDESYLQSVDSSLKDFSGFSVAVKNEAVGLPEISIAYGVMDSEKASLGQELKDFAKAGYNTNDLFAKDWVKDDGTLNTKQIAEDRYLLANKEKIFQKLTLDAATKAVEAYLKGKKNININETQQQGTASINKEDKTELDVVRDQFFSKTG